jgi:hypothetical protein
MAVSFINLKLGKVAFVLKKNLGTPKRKAILLACHMRSLLDCRAVEKKKP